MGQGSPKEKEAPLALLLEWLRSPLGNLPIDEHQVAELTGYSSDTLIWLVENEFVTRFYRGVGVTKGPGPRRTKIPTQAEITRAKLAIDNPSLKPSTNRFYKSVLGYGQSKELYKINPKGLPSMFEALFGLPNRVNATDFACTHDLPTVEVKKWFRNLVDSERASIIAVRGKRIIVPRRETER
jgi:hypothetical protein